MDKRRQFFDDLVALARERGYRPGYVGHKFEDAFGEKLPPEWLGEVKLAFKSDELWRRRQASADVVRIQRQTLSNIDQVVMALTMLRTTGSAKMRSSFGPLIDALCDAKQLIAKDLE